MNHLLLFAEASMAYLFKVPYIHVDDSNYDCYNKYCKKPAL